MSKWERGLGLMDLSLLKPLSKILGVLVTELLNGERVAIDEINFKSEEILIDTINYSSKKIQKVKKNKFLTIALTIVITILSIILLDTLQAILFKNSPIISWRTVDTNDNDGYIDKGILIDIYYCVKEQDIVTVISKFKNTNYNCPSE